MTTLDTAKHNELIDLIEDTVQYWCDENMMSGELTWIVVNCLATAKLAQLKGEIK